MLIEEGGLNVNKVNTSGNSCLHIAAKNGHLNICKYLVEEAQPIKADVLCKGLDNETPMEAAIDMGKFEVGNYLQVHQKRMINWQNRNCLLKLYLNKNKTEVFSRLTQGIFKEIIKYA